MARLKLIVAGAAGRMGRTVIQQALAMDGVEIAGALERKGCEAIGRDLGLLAGGGAIGVFVAESAAMARGSVLIDFTTPEASLVHARWAAENATPIVVGATGFSREQDSEIAALSAKVAIVKSGNFSIGVNLLAALAREAAKRLGADYDIEIIEAHHRDKRDAPSGTALMLGRAAAEGRGAEFDQVKASGDRRGARTPGAIGFSAVRGGGIIGDHELIFAGADEVIVLSHHAIDRGLFAKGAITAAQWLQSRPAGLYSMSDVLGLTMKAR